MNAKNELIISGVVGLAVISALLLIPAFAGNDVYVFERRVTATSNSTDTTDCINLANQYQIVLNTTNGDCYIRALANGNGISIQSNSTHLIINTTSSGGSETTVCNNLGSVGEGIVASSSDGNCDFKKLLGGTGISLSANGTRITITNTLPEATSASNVGSGEGLFKQETSNDLEFKSLIEGDGITITDTTDDYTINATRIGQLLLYAFQSVTKTNLPTSYTGIYTATFDADVLASVEFTNAKEVRILWAWDYVGSSAQQCRWVNRDNMAFVLYESSTFTADQTPNTYVFGVNTGDSGWFAKPANFNGEISILWQCKSANGTDDPIAKGYSIYVR